MPRLNSRGDWASGVGGGVVSFNSHPIASPAGGANWVDDDHIVYQLCDAPGCHVDRFHVLTAEVDTVLAHGANFIEAGGGVWAAWFGTLDPAQAGITLSDGRRFPSSGLGPVGPDGALALKVNYQSAGPWDVVEQDGTRWPLTAGDAGNINLLGQKRAVFSDEHGALHALGVPLPAVLTFPFYNLRVLHVAGAWWVLYQDDNGRLVLHPGDSSKGYVITQGNAFRPDAVQMPDGKVRVVWAISEGEPPADLRLLDVNPADARTELRPEAPVPAPTFPPLGRFWLGPNIGSVDQLQMFDDQANLRGCDTFTIYVQEILTDVSTPQLGTNIYPNLVTHDVFRKLKDWGIPLVIEMGSIKPGDCQAKGAVDGLKTAVARVADAGGDVAAIAMDEPLTSNQQACGGDLVKAADAVGAFIHAGRMLGVDVGWIEAWPEVGFNTMRLFLIELQKRQAVPPFLHPDIDHVRAKKEGKNVGNFINAAKGLCAEFGMTFGLLVNATKDPIPTDAEHYQNLDALAKTLQPMAPDALHVVTQSWASRVSPDPTHATQNVPNNLGPSGLLASLLNTRTIFGAAVPEPPEPPPVEMTDMMAYSTPIQGFLPGQLEPHPDGDGALLVRKPNGKVLCVTPDGAVEERDNAGPWEKFTKAKNGASLLAERDGGKVYVLGIAE